MFTAYGLLKSKTEFTFKWKPLKMIPLFELVDVTFERETQKLVFPESKRGKGK